MKRPFLVVLLVLALVGIPTAPLAHARVGAPPAWSAADTAAEAGQPQIAIVDQASRLLQDKFFEPIDTADLYSAAVDAANDELTAEKATARIAKPTFGKDAGRNWGLFYDAYMAAASSPGDSIDQKELAYAAIRGMVKSVKDCHTYFMTKEQYQQQLSMLSGNRSAQGIGAAIVEGEDGYIFASDVYAGTPAAKAGLRAGDKFLKVNGEDTKGWKTTELVAKIRERIGQPTQFTIGRPGAPEPIEVTITPGPYKVPDWESKMLDGGVGYFHLYSFVEGFDKQKVQDFYRELVDQGATSIVIDLRNNPGGYVSGLVALLSAMIPKDQPLFRYIARDGSEATSKSVDNLWPTKIPVAFLVNGGSGSAPEIVAAVAQDFGVAKVFGVKTGGCVGTVGYSELADGSALGITTTRIDTAKGRSLNRIGVTPDVVVERSREDLANARDPQLDAATTFLRGEAGNPTVASTGPATPGAPSVPG